MGADLADAAAVGHRVAILDGALGTELGRRGVDTRSRLFSAAALLDERFPERAKLAVAEARAAIPPGRKVHVAGSMAPLEDCYRPDLRPPPDVARREHEEHARELAGAGCDLLLVETVAASDEGLAA